MAILNNADYNAKRWQGTLIFTAIALFTMFFNTVMAKRLPLVESFILIIHVIGLFAIIIPLWVLAPRNTAKAVFTEFADNGGWGSTGIAVLIGMAQIASSMAGFDCAVHMAEEIKDAATTLPKAIMSGVAVNAVLGFLAIVTLSFTLGDVENILSTNTGYPFIQIIYNATQSYVGTDVMVASLWSPLLLASLVKLPRPPGNFGLSPETAHCRFRGSSHT